jgi:hypothetical protein
MGHMNQEMNAEDKAVYAAWMRRIWSAYGIAVIFGLGLVVLQASSHGSNTAGQVADAVTMAR